MGKQSILIICYSNHDHEPRLLLQVSALKERFNITTAGYSGLKEPNVGFIELKGDVDQPLFSFHIALPKLIRAPFSLVNKLHFFFTGKSHSYSRCDLQKLNSTKYDLIICHHPGSLEMAFVLKQKQNCKIVFNAHEIYPLEFDNDEEWMEKNSTRIDSILKQYLPFCEKVFTVNEEICEWYEKNFSCKCVPIHNSKPFYSIEPTKLKVPIQIIHHGGAMPQRKLEQMAESVLGCGNKYELTFMLVATNAKYLAELRKKYEPKGIKFIPAVSYQAIIETINKYDIGLYILPNETINHDLALPNKVFEFLQAKLAVITTPNKSMKKFVIDNIIGMVSAGFDSKDMQNLLSDLTVEQIKIFKENTKQASLRLSSEKDEAMILNTVKTLLEN